MVNGLHGKVEGHELANGLESIHSCASGNAGKAHLGNGGVDDTFGSKLLQKATAHLEFIVKRNQPYKF